jgi:hypothetical protein
VARSRAHFTTSTLIVLTETGTAEVTFLSDRIRTTPAECTAWMNPAKALFHSKEWRQIVIDHKPSVEPQKP